jgi:hypothetical protein
MLNIKKTCHPERSWERFLLPTESKDLQLLFVNVNIQARNVSRSSLNP